VTVASFSSLFNALIVCKAVRHSEKAMANITHLSNGGIFVYEEYLTVAFDSVDESAANYQVGGGGGFQCFESAQVGESLNIRTEPSNNAGRSSSIQEDYSLPLGICEDMSGDHNCKLWLPFLLRPGPRRS
jgi:hypothetical protein